MRKLLVVPAVETAPAIGITNLAALEKTGLLQVSRSITAIPDEQIRDHAIVAARKIKTHLDAVEKSRVEVKAPFLDVTRQIDEAARTHVALLQSELSRMNRLVGNFEEDRRCEIERRKEELRKEQELLVASALPPPPNEVAPGATPQEKATTLRTQIEAEEKIVAAEDKIQTLSSAAEQAAPSGGAMRRDWDIDITDIRLLYTAHPQCVELKARPMAIKDLLKAGITPPGVRATPKVAYNVRGGTAKALQP